MSFNVFGGVSAELDLQARAPSSPMGALPPIPQHTPSHFSYTPPRSFTPPSSVAAAETPPHWSHPPPPSDSDTDAAAQNNYIKSVDRVLQRSAQLRSQIAPVPFPRLATASSQSGTPDDSLYDFPDAHRIHSSRHNSFDFHEDDVEPLPELDEGSPAFDALVQQHATQAMLTYDLWFRPDLDRSNVDAYLRGQGEGWFVVRPSSHAESKALCVRMGNIVVHYLIER